MGKILDGFMKMHELDDAEVIAMIGNAALQIIDPDLSFKKIKENPPPESIKKEEEKLVHAAAFALVAALMERFEGVDRNG